ncbi:MAG TPA: marine proteobacterial sortase target protein [Xanthobacteraceae bacterium]|nr:marine proteobacterial sortase target protein [Xanthobacteraceae bacterium]
MPASVHVTTVKPRALATSSPPRWWSALFFILSAFAAFLASTGVVRAAAAGAAAFVTPSDMRSGSLLLRSTEDGRFVEAPRLGTDIDVTVNGPTARARVTQIFHNPTDGWVEAVYVYPLPDGGAVDTLKMVIGDRIVIGDIKERRQARQVYEDAKAAGHKAALIEQERPNIFTNSVANIGPGETVLVQIEYQEPIPQSGQVFALRVPLVVAPRYTPAPVAQTVDFRGGEGWGTTSDPVPDRDRITPPVLDPAQQAPVNPTSVTVRLQAGFPLGEVKSHHHNVKIETVADDARIIKLADGLVPADHDFELTWRAAPSKTPSVGLFRERVGKADYLLAFVTPPALPPTEDKRPREIIFVIDNSGSMGGTSIVQAKASLTYALGRLTPADRFNVIRFDHTMDVLFADTVPADAEHVGQAKRFVAALQAQGGTEMVPAMKAALTDPREGDSKYLRQVVFLTDGAIGNEQQMFETLGAMRGRSRVFMVGIGSAPNSFLMTRAAEIGRGTFTHIGSVEQVEERMRALFEKLESPAVTNLVATFSDAAADMTPAMLPDLYRGEPLVLAAKVEKLSGTLEIKGRIGDQPWSLRLPLADVAQGQGLSKVWARRKIADAEVARTLRRLKPEEADSVILALALDHRLVTRLTSLVAVDATPSRPDGARLIRADLPLNLPAGWDFDKVFGERPAPPPQPSDLRRADRNGTQGAQLTAASFRAIAKSTLPQPAAPAGGGPAAGGVSLPQTATDAELRAWFGIALLIASVMLMLFRRRAQAVR